MRRLTVVLLVMLLAMLGLAGCGTKSAADVVDDLNDQLNELTSYQVRANLQLHTGQTPQTYDVEVWYKKPHYYRISLRNAERNITQIILRNDEGVYVLTPELKKVFRFDSDWPENQRVFYLYESLVQSIVNDEERKFATDGDRYLFDVVADYPNRSLVRQKIWLYKDLAPDRVEVLDADGNVMVSVAFRDFRAGVTFDENAFDKERNLTGALLDSVPASTPTRRRTCRRSFPPTSPLASRWWMWPRSTVARRWCSSTRGPIPIICWRSGPKPLRPASRTACRSISGLPSPSCPKGRSGRCAGRTAASITCSPAICRWRKWCAWRCPRSRQPASKRRSPMVRQGACRLLFWAPRALTGAPAGVTIRGEKNGRNSTTRVNRAVRCTQRGGGSCRSLPFFGKNGPHTVCCSAAKIAS
ncbi:LolA family protein [Calditerricola satsumensis]|uniref:LolA family protein n=1 Tax=Calditerricola satsumensis TaxID=373054 RepID=UPI000A83BE81|nr:outer membrane lipoprotein carrier protein LolA [Calditerricola satsumensis]